MYRSINSTNGRLALDSVVNSNHHCHKWRLRDTAHHAFHKGGDIGRSAGSLPIPRCVSIPYKVPIHARARTAQSDTAIISADQCGGKAGPVDLC